MAEPVAHAVAIDQGTTGLKMGIVSFAGERFPKLYKSQKGMFGRLNGRA